MEICFERLVIARILASRGDFKTRDNKLTALGYARIKCPLEYAERFMSLRLHWRCMKKKKRKTKRNI